MPHDNFSPSLKNGGKTNKLIKRNVQGQKPYLLRGHSQSLILTCRSVSWANPQAATQGHSRRAELSGRPHGVPPRPPTAWGIWEVHLVFHHPFRSPKCARTAQPRVLEVWGVCFLSSFVKEIQHGIHERFHTFSAGTVNPLCKSRDN